MRHASCRHGKKHSSGREAVQCKGCHNLELFPDCRPRPLLKVPIQLLSCTQHTCNSLACARFPCALCHSVLECLFRGYAQKRGCLSIKALTSYLDPKSTKSYGQNPLNEAQKAIGLHTIGIQVVVFLAPDSTPASDASPLLQPGQLCMFNGRVRMLNLWGLRFRALRHVKERGLSISRLPGVGSTTAIEYPEKNAEQLLRFLCWHVCLTALVGVGVLRIHCFRQARVLGGWRPPPTPATRN